MTKREVAILACRVLSIYTLIVAVAWVPEIVQDLSQVMQWANPYFWMQLVIYLIGPAVMLVLARYLWRRAGVIGAWIFGHDLQDDQHEKDSVVVHASLDDAQVIAFSLIGVWLIVDSLVSGTGYGVQILLTAFLSAEPWEGWSIWTGVTLAELLVRFLLGIWLIFGSQRIVGWLKQLKNVGLDSVDNESTRANSAPPRDDD